MAPRPRPVPRLRWSRAHLLYYMFGERRLRIRTFGWHLGALFALAEAVAQLPWDSGRRAFLYLLPVFVFPEVVGRLHDSGRGAAWAAVPVGFIVAAQNGGPFLSAFPHPAVKVVYFCVMAGWLALSARLLMQAGDVGPNRFGPDPRGSAI